MSDEISTGQPVELIAPRAQRVWRAPAVANFSLGGLGAGFYVVATVAASLGPSRTLRVAAWLAPLLIFAGFAAVALEAGRPFRGPRVITRVRTSWMSRELALGALFAVLAVADLVAPATAWRAGAAVVALVFVLAQGLMVQQARAVPAWSVPATPMLFFSSAIISGAALYVLVRLVIGPVPGPALLGAMMPLLVFGMVVWLAWLTWSDDEVFLRATAPLRRGITGLELTALGYVVPFLLAGLALALPAIAAPAAAAAAVSIIVGHIRAKAALILRAGQLRPITLGSLTLHRRAS